MNNQSIIYRLGFALAAFIIVLVIPALINAQDYPPIPHQLEKRENCLKCHEEGKLKSPKIPEDHADITNEECQECHRPIDEVEIAAETETMSSPPLLTSTLVISAPDYPLIPHQLEDREDCLDCHETGRLKSPKIPEDHGDRSNQVCRDCHLSEAETGTRSGPPLVPHDLAFRENCMDCHTSPQPTPTPQPTRLPTPIPHPQARGVNTCIDCHSTLEDEELRTIVDQAQRSIHAERDVSCADCHGGDPSASEKEAAKSPEAGYIGRPAKADIPALCASCHGSVVQMRQYDLPTDQYAKYHESIHGIRLTEGDENVATCFDCHGGHQILKANDPASSVYPPNVPSMCADCHADEGMMEPYEIPTNQFDLYRQSVHGDALLDNHDLRAPTCATCHGTHGAAPPGFDEVANVCGSCHSATQEYYLESPHAAEDDIGPKCVTCHGRYDVSKPSEALYLGAEPRHCGECHDPDDEGSRVAESLYEAITTAAESYEQAEAAIQNVRSVGMLVSSLEGQLRQANTDLVTARAAQHTLDLEVVAERATKAREVAEEVQANAEAALEANLFRRRAMVIAVAAIALTIAPLYVLKRELDRQLEEEDE